MITITIKFNSVTTYGYTIKTFFFNNVYILRWIDVVSVFKALTLYKTKTLRWIKLVMMVIED